MRNAVRCDAPRSQNENFRIAERERSGTVAGLWMEHVPAVLDRREGADAAGEGGKKGGSRAGNTG